jgi:hypothetical protein
VPRLSRAFFEKSQASRAEKALFVLTVLLVLSSSTEVTGTDLVLGAFLAGLTMNRVLARREELREHIEFVGSEAGLLPAKVVDAVVLLILVTSFAGPVLVDRVGQRIQAESPV